MERGIVLTTGVENANSQPVKPVPNFCEFYHYQASGKKRMYEPFYYQLMHIMLKNTELLKHSKITLQHVSVYIETIFRELKSVLG